MIYNLLKQIFIKGILRSYYDPDFHFIVSAALPMKKNALDI